MRKALKVVLIVGVVLIVAVALLSWLASPSGPKVRVERPTVPMADGVRLAVDVVLPDPLPAARVPAVLVQSRYWRSFGLRLPDPPGAVPPMPREPIADRLVEAGYAVVVADVRGTGASEGAWVRPWTDAELADAGTLIGWIAAQPWSNGRVGTTGVSYEGSTALLAAASAPPALKAVLARELEWDLVDELLAPARVRNVSFVDAWGRSVGALDRNLYPELFPSTGAFFVTGVHPVDGDAEGARLAGVVSARTLADVAKDVSAIRSGADPWGSGGPAASTVGPSAHAARLAGTSAAVAIWGSWWDGATADAVLRASDAMPLVDAVIGPWDHEGTKSASPFGDAPGSTVALADVVAFFDRHLREDGPRPPRRRWWVVGADRWEEGPAWPGGIAHAWNLTSGGRLVEGAVDVLDVSLPVDFATTLGPDTRWSAGLLHPVKYDELDGRAGTLAFEAAASTGPIAAFGAPSFTCTFALDGDEAAAHVTLETRGPDGRVRYLTEGVARLGSGPATIRLRPLGLELPTGHALRVVVAGADAGTFERVPATGPRTITLKGSATEPCRLELPLRQGR